MAESSKDSDGGMNEIIAKIHVARHTPGGPGSVFALDSFDLEFTGKIDGNHMEGMGHLVAQPDDKIAITFKRLADLPL